MARDIVLRKIDKDDPPELNLGWSRNISLTWRIMAVNAVTLLLFAAGLLLLDNFRTELLIKRQEISRNYIKNIAFTLPKLDENEQRQYLQKFGETNELRIRFYDKNGRKNFDSFAEFGPSYEERNPDDENFNKRAARQMDIIIDWLILAKPLPLYIMDRDENISSWPYLLARQKNGQNLYIRTQARYAPDRTPVILAGSYLPKQQKFIHLTLNARDIRTSVRAERFNIGMFILLMLGFAILLSLFLARTIVRPLRYLAHAATKVKFGRAFDIDLPRLPSRRDEIGMLARALADMNESLRNRLDATEAFAADVAHEIKNPLASLRSAIEGMNNIKDADLQRQLLDIAMDDVMRMDRLITDISEASRVDSLLARTDFEEIDVGDLISYILNERKQRADHLDQHNIKFAFARPRKNVAIIKGDEARLFRAIDNIIDNAISFSPHNGLIEIRATRTETAIIIQIIDEGPGVPVHLRQEIFTRFHSIRNDKEEFGKHSGLGLAIASAIIKGHRGTISVHDRDDHKNGANFVIKLPPIENLDSDNKDEDA
ncbi:hypothetical protein LPB140_08510 [Sphingorhabdus lutea]|uniref:histidine kinase n=1 Tax=Sphingorhabdus lutea TaxID=1913578 RepID=A0A1L3JCH4_9SPHN|nr:HAMP domain-containing sensor histidine kinase [Sphingorhabdus lutea]APG62824.1 hypothetical protein LPB140_08510 [Sphingorhabdus lutea]